MISALTSRSICTVRTSDISPAAPAHRATMCHRNRIDLEHVRAIVPGLRVIGLMQADRFRVVIDGNIDRATNGLLPEANADS